MAMKLEDEAKGVQDGSVEHIVEGAFSLLDQQECDEVWGIVGSVIDEIRREHQEQLLEA